MTRYNNSHAVLPVNLDKNERLISLATGIIMIVYGLVRLPISAVMALIAGAYLLYRAIKGHCFIYAQLGLNEMNKPTPTRLIKKTADRQHTNSVDATLDDSFPTSDPPAWTMGRDQ